MIVFSVLQTQLGSFFRRKSDKHSIENVIVSLLLVLWKPLSVRRTIRQIFTCLKSKTTFLKKILLDASAFNDALSTEVNFDVFSKSTRIVITNGSRISKR